MRRVRVHELAKELGITSRSAVSKLSELGIFVRSASSTIDVASVKALREAIGESSKDAFGASVTPRQLGWNAGAANLSPSTINQLNSLSRFGLSEKALVLYGRWWQLEDWLRQLAYVELRAKYGRSWSTNIGGSTSNQDKDAEWTHMLARDNENPLAYLDFPKLSDLMIAEWDIFKVALPRLETWKSHASELNMVRRRIAHLRLAHSDDLARLEQALRDLERGAFITLATYNTRWPPQSASDPDPIVDGWIKKTHDDAQRLIDHANRQYEVSFDLRISRRPWAGSQGVPPGPGPGKLWHAEFYSTRPIDLAKLWRTGSFAKPRDLVIHVEANSPNSVSFTFADVDDHDEIADAIGNAFDAILTARVRIDETSHYEWQRAARELNYRIAAGSGWNIVNETTLPISIFGSGGSIQEFPRW